MNYSIGEVAQRTGLPVSTLHYYDREGLFPNIARSNGGTRVFSDAEIETLKVIECLKRSGMPIKDIRQFLDWCQEGDASLEQRRNMFHGRLDAVSKQMEELQRTLDMITYKCWYYDSALEAGTEKDVKDTVPESMPAEIERCFRNAFSS